ncbi:MAG: transglutaminase domain-containing protein [Candidatus Fermentibacteraceae bacterium]
MLALLFLTGTSVSAPGVEYCMEFLLERSPRSDSLEPGFSMLLENTELALLTRELLPWGPAVPDSVFLRYVLPARVSQEPLTRWRPVFIEHVLPLVQGVTDIEEAVLIISAWSDSLTDYRPTQLRDQSPLVTWSSGIGRCEELTVFFMDALRSVGIPCRQVYTPWWLTVDGNHAWPEVWTPGGWKCLERVSTESRLPQENWFTERAAASALILAVVSDSVDGAVRFSSGVSFLPVTSSYAVTGLLEVADDSAEVWVNVFNYGAPRRILTLSPPLREVELGAGSYLLTWGWPVRTAMVEVSPGDTTWFYPRESEDSGVEAVMGIGVVE